MSGLISKLFGRSTAGKVKVSPLSTRELRKAMPETPTNDDIRERVSQYVLRTQADQPLQAQEFVRRQMFFDLRYRCGAQGRCFKGAGRCCFPRCFTLRPSIKGGEILVEKGQIEEAIATSKDVPANIRALAELSSKDERMAEIADMITEELTSLLEPFKDSGMEEVDEREVGHLIILAVWRAVLLVNDGQDEKAVDQLLELALKLPRHHRGALFSSAAGWAALGDMEVRFYKQHVPMFPDIVEELNDPKIHERPANLLKKVVDAAANDEALVRQVAYEVFSKEISAIIARAQNAQEHNDDVEDPMGTSVVFDSVNHYHAEISGQFWDDFMNLAMMPPMVPSKEELERMELLQKSPNKEALPRHVLDALGRSMLLHHCAATYGALPGTTDHLDSEKIKNEDGMRQKAILNRMAELVNIVKNSTGPGGMPSSSSAASSSVPLDMEFGDNPADELTPRRGTGAM